MTESSAYIIMGNFIIYNTFTFGQEYMRSWSINILLKAWQYFLVKSGIEGPWWWTWMDWCTLASMIRKLFWFYKGSVSSLISVSFCLHLVHKAEHMSRNGRDGCAMPFLESKFHSLLSSERKTHILIFVFSSLDAIICLCITLLGAKMSDKFCAKSNDTHTTSLSIKVPSGW